MQAVLAPKQMSMNYPGIKLEDDIHPWGQGGLAEASQQG